MKPKFKLVIKILVFLCLLSFVYRSSGYIERRYTLQEVIESCTNIVFGTIKSVDSKRLRAIIKVDEDVLGESGLEKIKINLAVGQRRPETSPEKMVEYFREGKPAVIFYDMHSGQLNSLGHVGGKWFQCKTYVGKKWEDSNWRDKWWNFTHLEIHLYHAYKGWTVNLQEKVREVVKDMNVILAEEPAPEFKGASEKHIKMLLFSNREYHTEFRTLRRIREIGKYRLACQRTYDSDLPGIGQANILWIGYRALGEDGYQLNDNSEKKIRKFVKNGGVVIVSGQDSDIDSTDWFEGKIKGDESEVQIGIRPKNNAEGIFKQPNKVATDDIYTEDSWQDWGRHFDVLAKTHDGRNVAVGKLKHGKGMYLITSLHHQTFFQVARSQRLMENLVYLAAKHLDSNKIIGASRKVVQSQPTVAINSQSSDEPKEKGKEVNGQKSKPKQRVSPTSRSSQATRASSGDLPAPVPSVSFGQSVEKRSPSILQELESGDTKTRKNAVQQLANLGHSAALLTALDDPELSIRKLAVQKIIELDSSQGLVIAMNDQNPLIREMAARKLVKKFDIHGLEKVYNDSNEKVRNIALEAFEENPSFTINMMFDALNSYDNLIRNFATSVLEDMTGKNSVDEFYEWRQNRLDPGLLMTLYQGVDFENKAASRVSSSVELNQEMDEFDRNVTDGFSVRWIGYLSVPENKIYLFTVRHNGGIRFWIDGEKLISNKSISPREKTDLKALHLKKGYHSIRLEYRNNANDGLILLLWNSGLRDLVIPEENMFHLARAANR